MQKDLETDISEIVKTLKNIGKVRLARAIEENWQKTALAYSQEVNTYSPIRPMEKAMENAFRKELERIGSKDKESIEKIIASISRRRVIQTAPHLGATENSRMLTINWLGSLGVREDEYYIVGMYSKIPFSNDSRPGRINRKIDSVNLFPSSMQDDTVFQSKVPQKLLDSVETLPTELKKLLPPAHVGESYTKWAIQSCENIERKILKKENLIYVDINEVVANYLEEIKDIPDHPMHKIKELEEKNLFLSFAPLLFNHFKCFGSFRQVEYLPEYRDKLAHIIEGYDIEKVPTESLTTGEFKEKSFPADIILGEDFSPSPDILFGEMLTGMKETLYGK